MIGFTIKKHSTRLPSETITISFTSSQTNQEYSSFQINVNYDYPFEFKGISIYNHIPTRPQRAKVTAPPQPHALDSISQQQSTVNPIFINSPNVPTQSIRLFQQDSTITLVQSQQVPPQENVRTTPQLQDRINTPLQSANMFQHFLQPFPSLTNADSNGTRRIISTLQSPTHNPQRTESSTTFPNLTPYYCPQNRVTFLSLDQFANINHLLSHRHSFIWKGYTIYTLNNIQLKPPLQIHKQPLRD